MKAFTDRSHSQGLQESIFAEALGVGNGAASASAVPASTDGEENVGRSGQSDAPAVSYPTIPSPVPPKNVMRGSQGDLAANPETTGIDSVEPEVSWFREMAGEEDGGDGHLASTGDKAQKKYHTRPGEIPAVQERYYALLKRRLKTEIQQHPPLFPWETDDIFEYEAEILDSSAGEIVPTKRVWLPQLHSLNLPVPLPEQILAQLFALTNKLINSSLREGEMLVRAVESLFPGQTAELNNLARLTIASPVRSAATVGERLSKTALGLPDRYDEANPTQQMLLSLLAAREMVGALTINLSPTRPCQERQWLTAAGMLKLEVSYQQSSLKVRACLPDGGRLYLSGDKQVQTANHTHTRERGERGWVSLELGGAQPEQTYSLEIQLASGEQFEPLTFAISVTAAEF
ncbi:MAG TPA: PatU [Oscillatoriaceae cyanobacterium M33_DOE_052]|uniref:PatU n=1 Tax=Planktothricoides sp. SpSt-374 TaxID=2282167 RepID=A0A7C3ZQQ3_9CYAN|nr:PatU [Oscillatoriaceae cyanobacterium M33_DOE_052]